MFTVIRPFFSLPNYPGDLKKTQDARTAHRVAMSLFLIAFLSIPFIFQLQSPVREIALYATLGGQLVWAACIWLIKNQRIGLAKLILISINTFNIYIVIALNGGFSRPIIMVTFFLMALAVLLYPIRGALLFGIFNLVIGSVIYALSETGIIPPSLAPNPLLDTFLLFLFTAIASPVILEIASANNQSLVQAVSQREIELRDKNQALESLRQELEQRIAERTAALELSNQRSERRANQLQAVNSIARAISTIQDFDKLLPAITQAISGGFGIYHAGIFLLDKRGEYAELRATNSPGGQRMLARNHRLRVGEEGIIGYVTKFGRARISLDVGEDAVFFNNPDLPETRSEIGLPLIVAGNIIGALDVQSTDANAFSAEDISALSALANQVSIAIQNADLFTQAQQSAREIERTYRSYVTREWQRIAPVLPVNGYTYSSSGIAPLQESETAGKDAVTIPVTLRGGTIGELGIRTRSAETRLNPDEMAILRATADRVALALENARLFQEAQLRAATERAISNMSSKIAASVDVDAILQSTVQELGQLVSDSEIVIQLGPQQAKQP